MGKRRASKISKLRLKVRSSAILGRQRRCFVPLDDDLFFFLCVCVCTVQFKKKTYSRYLSKDFFCQWRFSFFLSLCLSQWPDLFSQTAAFWKEQLLLRNRGQKPQSNSLSLSKKKAPTFSIPIQLQHGKFVVILLQDCLWVILSQCESVSTRAIVSSGAKKGLEWWKKKIRDSSCLILQREREKVLVPIIPLPTLLFFPLHFTIQFNFLLLISHKKKNHAKQWKSSPDYYCYFAFLSQKKPSWNSCGFSSSEIGKRNWKKVPKMSARNGISFLNRPRKKTYEKLETLNKKKIFFSCRHVPKKGIYFARKFFFFFFLFPVSRCVISWNSLPHTLKIFWEKNATDSPLWRTSPSTHIRRG